MDVERRSPTAGATAVVRATTCIACGGQLPPGLFLYCSPECSLASRQMVWKRLYPDRELPEALLTQ